MRRKPGLETPPTKGEAEAGRGGGLLEALGELLGLLLPLTGREDRA